MGPTYLVLLRGGDSAVILYDGTDETIARMKYESAHVEYRDVHSVTDGTCGVYLVTVRAEAAL